MFLYSAVSSPLDRSKRCTLFPLPGRPVHSDTNSASPGSILAMLQLRATTKSLTFPPLSRARYSFIALNHTGENENAQSSKVCFKFLKNIHSLSQQVDIVYNLEIADLTYIMLLT